MGFAGAQPILRLKRAKRRRSPGDHPATHSLYKIRRISFMAGIALEIPASIPRWELFFCGYQFVGNESPIELKLWRRSDSETAGMYLMKYALRKGENLGCTDTDQRTPSPGVLDGTRARKQIPI